MNRTPAFLLFLGGLLLVWLTLAGNSDGVPRLGSFLAVIVSPQRVVKTSG